MNPNEILSKINNTAIADNIRNVSLELLNYLMEMFIKRILIYKDIEIGIFIAKYAIN